MSRTFSTKAGSLDSLKLRERCGAMPAARNRRCAMSLLMFASAAKLRTLQTRPAKQTHWSAWFNRSATR